MPIETTFERYRKTVPAAEPTPDPSPRDSPVSMSPPPPLPKEPAKRDAQSRPPNKEKRRFAPQLVESSRRSRKAGDVGPTTKPVDKTDITPYTNHIYSLTSKKKHNSRHPGHARRESCDDEISELVFDLNKLDAQRRIEDMAMSAFPNSGIRLGGAEHFFVREGSEDDSDGSSQRGRSLTRPQNEKKHSRRGSSEVGWAVKEMQEHAEVLRHERGEDFDSSMSEVGSIGPPDNTFHFTGSRARTGPLSPIGEHPMPLIPSEPVKPEGSQLWNKSQDPDSYFPRAESPPIRPIGESYMPYIPSAPPGKAADMPYIAPASQIPPETGFRNRAPFGAFAGYRNQDREAERDLHRMRTQRSPPMLGKDLVFRMCPSPQQTKLEPDQKWDKETCTTEEPNRDVSGQRGLWRGYCYTNDTKHEALVPAERPAMISTPMPPATPREHSDPFSTAFSAHATFSLSEEPTPLHTGSYPTISTSEHRSRGAPKGLHMLMGLEERLKQEKALADLEEKIASEFTDDFVTQVYNYLSLGYPAMARMYDDELSKISRYSLEELEHDDDAVMDGIGSNAKGHIKIEMDIDTAEDDRCPRWRALKQYIFEWARQHPDLDNISPRPWGVQERRGSWGL